MIKKWSKYKITIRIILSIIILIAIAFLMLKKTAKDNFYKELLNVNLPKDSIILIKKDSHGGFHGDGEYYEEIQLTKDGSKTFINNITETGKWHPIPLPVDFAIIIYGGDYNDTYYDIGKLSKNIPKNIKNGLYYVRDRFAKNYPKEKNTNINSRVSYNVTISIFDFDTNKLYIYKLDT